MTMPGAKRGRAGLVLAGAVLALPAGLGGAWLLWRRAPLELLGTQTLRACGILLGVALLGFALAGLARRRLVAGGTSLGMLLLLGTVFAAAHLRFHGWVSLGDGEPGAGWTRVESGPGGASPRRPPGFTVDPGDGVPVLTVEGRARRVRPGQWVVRAGSAARVVRVRSAPAFTLAQADGRVEDEILVKLSPSDPAGRFFQMSVLPYRFFTSLPDADASPGASEAPGRIAVRVTRGKLNVAAKTLAAGDPLDFEGFRLTWAEGAAWAELEVWSVPAWVLLPFGAGLALLAACGVAAARAGTRAAGADPCREASGSAGSGADG